MPGLDAFDVRRSGQTGGDVDAAVVVAADGHRWVVRAPRDAAAGAALEAETALLGALARHVDDGRLPFAVPRPVGFAPLPEGGRAMVHPLLPGRPLALERLGPGPGLAADVGRAVAAVHQLPPEVVEDAGLPTYDAESYRRRRLSEVDEAARTGRVPGSLLRRWEHALEDVAMWRFQPTVTHGDLTTEHVLCRGERVAAVLGWSEAKVADPADDLAWLLVAAPQEAVDPILESYAMHRSEMRDRHLADRALLAGELALARWLLHGVRVDDPEVVDDATAMLVELDEQTSEQVTPIGTGWSSGPTDGAVAGPATDDASGDEDPATDAAEEDLVAADAVEKDLVAADADDAAGPDGSPVVASDPASTEDEAKEIDADDHIPGDDAPGEDVSGEAPPSR